MTLDSVTSVADLDGRYLAITCNGATSGGGLFLFDGTRVEQVDDISSTGLWVDADQSLVIRGFLSQEAGSRGEIVTYDPNGVTRYLRIDDLYDTHDVRFDGRHIVAVSTSSDEILWIGLDGSVHRSWSAGGDGDACHLNSLAEVHGRLHVCAFGRFSRHREWSDARGTRSGIVIDVESGNVVLDGLEAPHDPRMLDGRWIVCDSGTHRLLRIDPDTGTVTDEVQLGGWTRGLAWTSNQLFVGASASRLDGDVGHAVVTVLTRDTLREIAQFHVPAQEIYDIVVIDASMANGLRTGFRTNASRFHERERAGMGMLGLGADDSALVRVGAPLDEADFAIAVRADVPRRLRTATLVRLQCNVTNRGNAILATTPPHPTRIVYRWRRAGSDELTGFEAIQHRSPLKEPLAPGETRTYDWELLTPDAPGEYELDLTLIQEDVAWFDLVDASNRVTSNVTMFR